MIIEYFSKYVIINMWGEIMNEITELNNTIKYDYGKCTQCVKCVRNCPTRALCLFENKIELKNKYCIACKKCIQICDKNALYYNIKDGIIEGNNVTAILPYDADIRFLNKKYGNIITYETGEKVKVIETAFEMENLTSKKINGDLSKPLIISDMLNIELILKHQYPQLQQYLSSIKDVYYISSYLTRLQNKNIKTVLYSIPFEAKNYFNDLNKKCVSLINNNIKEFKIAHSTGPITVSLPFESGARVIRFIAETNPTSKLAGYPILDMPMIQEDALYVLKFLLNDQNLNGTKLEFTSGVRVNDIRTWKNTGYAFELHTNDAAQLIKALEAVKKETSWTMNGIEYPSFAYQQSGNDFVISVYPEVNEPVKSE
mgnify:CR=1 FL=1